MHCLRTSIASVAAVVLLALPSCTPPATQVRTRAGASECLPLAGGCVPSAIAQLYCGGRAVATSTGCTPRPPCERGRARDLASGECLPRREVRALAIEIGIPATEEDDVVCEKGELVASVSDPAGPRRMGCLPDLPSSLIEEKKETRAPALRRGSAVDVVRWTAVNLGADGASEGGKPLCAALATQPGALAAPTGEVRAEIGLSFPDNDVSQVVVRARPTSAQPGVSGSEAATELERVSGLLVEALRGMGGAGAATEATITTRVRCHRASFRPVLEARHE